MDDIRQLIDAAKRKDAAAMQTLMEQHLPGLRAFVRLRINGSLREKESRSDLVQSACREVLEHLDHFEYRGETSFRHWLYTIALNKIREKGRYWLAQRRDPKRERPLPESGNSQAQLLSGYATLCTPSQEAMAHELVERLETAFDRMPPDYREVLTLSRLLGLGHAEIAEQMERSEVAVRTLLSRAMVRLSSLLAEGGDGAGGT